MSLDETQLKMLGELKKKRGMAKAALTRVRTFVSKFDPREQAVSLLEFRQEELPKINVKFDDVQSQIELLEINNEESHEIERENFEGDYFAIRSQIQEIIHMERASNSTVHNASYGASQLANRAQLAPIPLPKFNGNIQEWSSFYDIYRAMVHNDDGYSAAQKFFYLRSCLEGPALDLVRSIPVNDGNYDAVIERLTQRYDNQSLVIQSHIRAILECPRIEDSSPGTLQKLHSCVCTHVAALKALKQPVEYWDAWLITIIVSRLDRGTAHGWQLHQRSTELPKYAELEAFLASRCVAIESSDVQKQLAVNSSEDLPPKGCGAKRSGGTANLKRALVATDNRPMRPCVCCSEPHRLNFCDKFKELTTQARLDVARENRICFNCLSPSHFAESCKSTYSCRHCRKKHNTLLHLENRFKNLDSNTGEGVQKESSKMLPTSETSSSAPVALFTGANLEHVFLSTASVWVVHRNGLRQRCRAVLDCGSQINFISKSFSKTLQLPSKQAEMIVSGIGGNRARSVAVMEVQVQSRVQQYSVRLSCQVMPTLVGRLPPCPVPMERFRITDEVFKNLADPMFAEAGPIDLLIGGGAFYDILQPERISVGISTVKLQGSRFGWLVTGETVPTCLLGVGSIGETTEMEWKALISDEENRYGQASKNNKKCIEEEQARLHFSQTAVRDKEGRFVLRLPMKGDVSSIGKTINMARSRFLNVERKLQRDEPLRVEYSQFMKEFMTMNHMEEILNETKIPERACYLPHHAIVKLASLTTKVRVVFDASAKGDKGLALNDILLCGPTVQDDVFTILSRFRKHQFVIMADVEKMYRQIKIAPEDCDLQRILWRSDPSEELRSYRLLRITYGTASASFMATQCLVTLADKYEQEYPLASKSIREDFYMDDLMTGHETEIGCVQLQQQISAVLESAKLPLRKWVSNSKYVRQQIGKSCDDPLFALEIGNDDTVKTLGLCWKPGVDEFHFNVAQISSKAPLTKRMLLSDLNRVFDPLGFLVPVLIKGKIFLQQLWQMKANWDSKLPEGMQEKWKTFYAELEEMKHLSIPRGTVGTSIQTWEIHGFCDASQEAYGACVYIRSLNQDGSWESRLLCAKSRVAPLKGATIPRLELNGALCLAHLVHKVAEAWKIDCRVCKLWTDSTVVLGWLNAQSSCLKVYVANRVNQILEITNVKQWRYVNTLDNPADIVSRGISVKEMLKAELWWKGPRWLSKNEDVWENTSCTLVNENELPERRPLRLALAISDVFTDSLIEHYSEWNRLKRGVAWLLRFAGYIIAKRAVVRTSYLSVSELRQAESYIIRRVQAESFTDEVRALKDNKDLPSRSRLKCLAPYLKDRLILVGGRLNNAHTLETRKHPVVLPANHKVTQLIFKHTHLEQLHCGPQALLAEVRRQYWPLKARILARSVVLKCVRCARAKPRLMEPVMAALPRQRVQGARPFAITGVDFAGPLIIRSGIRRIVGIKAWIAVFVCFTTRAIHLEVVEDLTGQAFVATLRRFMARRGYCNTIFSDNGTNFVGAQRELAAAVLKAGPQMAREGVEWRFNPPAAPHFGGLWESAVKSAKHHLTRMMGATKLTISELNTLLCQIEACLNSRPMTPMSSDPSDLEALTPAHFLIGGPLSLPPEPNLISENPGHLRRWKYVQLLMQTFWRRWQTEYLPQLQVRGKWTANTGALKINDVVIVKEENTPPTKWKLARVTQLHPGSDGVVRVATVRLASGSEIKRPSVKLCILPTENDCEEVEKVDFQRGENDDANNVEAD